MPREVNAKLQQVGSFGQLREFQILDGTELRVSTQYKNKQSAYLVSLLALEDEPHTCFHFARRWLIAAAIPLSILLIFWLLLKFSDIDAGAYSLPLMGGLGLLGLAFLSLFIMNTCRYRVYRSRHAHIDLFRIRMGKPSQQEYKAFIEVLDSFIEKCRDYWQLTQEQQIAGEMRTLRRLANEKVISQAVYEDAKARLFALGSGAPQSGATAG